MHGSRIPVTFLIALAGATTLATGVAAQVEPATSPSAIPMASPSTTSGASGSAPAPATIEVTSDTFRVPFSVAVPSNWKVAIDRSDIFHVGQMLPSGDWPMIGIDLTVADDVNPDPCRGEVGAAVTIGSTAQDLADWMASLDPLAAPAPVAVDIAGRETWVIDEAFVAAAGCVELQLWDNDGGWVFPQEHKRYYLFDVDGQRVVAVIMGPDETFDRDVAEAIAALGTFRFDAEPVE